jgi:hypothetical protein
MDNANERIRERTTWLREPTLETIADIYDSEINGSISWDWDAGFTAKIGDEMNSFKDEATFEDILSVVAWLNERIVALYPRSKIARSQEVIDNH